MDTHSELMIREHRLRWNAPKKHARTTPMFKSGFADAFRSILDRLGTEDGGLIALLGTRGNGKTQLGVEAMKVVTSELRTAFYETAVGFFMRIKECYGGRTTKTERSVMAFYRRPSLLVIDEMGKRSNNVWEHTVLFQLIDSRYGDEKDTILISNQDEPEFTRAIGQSLASRMKETGGIIHCNWEPFR